VAAIGQKAAKTPTWQTSCQHVNHASI
jgi:hypothetical protein